MKKLLSLILISLCALARADDAELRKAFAQAGQDYDAGNFEGAAARYEAILASGHRAPELFFNLGNAYFKEGNYGQAILNYRRAWMDRPRDAELSANLKFAVQTSGALIPPESPFRHAASRLALREWVWLATACYWAGALSLALFWLLRKRHPGLMRFAAVCGFGMLVALGGVFFWLNFNRHPECVVIKSGQQALFAPIERATPHFALPPGSVLRVQETSGPWIRVTSGKDSGWIHESATARVSAWQLNG